jgi:ATP-dependent 26S proteasome regulatory subunit
MECERDAVDKAKLKPGTRTALVQLAANPAIVDKYIGESARLLREMFDYWWRWPSLFH